MRWKEILIGAAVTLVVTVIGGLLVYFFTAAKEEPKAERLSYQLDKQVSFEGSDNKLSIGALKFSNIGNEPSINITAEFRSKAADIIEFKITNEGGGEITRVISEDKKSVFLKIKNLMPEEIISVTYLLNSQSPVDFKIRSERTIGKEGAVYRLNKESKSILNDFLGDFVPFLILVAVAPLVLILKFLRSNTSRGDSKNNMAFVLLHKGAVNEAITILKSAVFEGEDGSHALSNYAAALAISGDTGSSLKYIEASMFLAKTKHEKAVCELNNSIIQHFLNNESESLKSLQNALRLSKSEIKSYIESSVVIGEIISAKKAFSDAVENA